MYMEYFNYFLFFMILYLGYWLTQAERKIKELGLI